MGFCSDWAYKCAYKIGRQVALPVPQIIGGIQKIWAVPGYATLHFLQNF